MDAAPPIGAVPSSKFASLAHVRLQLLREVDALFAAGAGSYQALKSALADRVGTDLFEMYKENIQLRLQELHKGNAANLPSAQAEFPWRAATLAPADSSDDPEPNNCASASPVVGAIADLAMRISGARSRMQIIDILFSSQHLMRGLTMPHLAFVTMKQIQKDLLREEFVIGERLFSEHLLARETQLASPRSNSPAASPGRSHRSDSIDSGFGVLEARLHEALGPETHDDPEVMAWVVQAMSRTIHGGDSFFHIHALFQSLDVVLTPCGEQLLRPDHKTSVSTFKAEGFAEGFDARHDTYVEVVTHNLYDLRPSSEMNNHSSSAMERSSLWLGLDVVICHYRNLRTHQSFRTMDIVSQDVDDYAETLQFLLSRGVAGFGLCRRCKCHRLLATCAACTVAAPGETQHPSLHKTPLLRRNVPTTAARNPHAFTEQPKYHKVHHQTFAPHLSSRFSPEPQLGGYAASPLDDQTSRRTRHLKAAQSQVSKVPTRPPSEQAQMLLTMEGLELQPTLGASHDANAIKQWRFLSPPIAFNIICCGEPVVPNLLDGRLGTGCRMLRMKDEAIKRTEAARLPSLFPASVFAGRCRVVAGLDLVNNQYLEPYVDALTAITDVSMQDFVPREHRPAFMEYVSRQHKSRSDGLPGSAVASTTKPQVVPWNPRQNSISFHLRNADACVSCDDVLLQFMCSRPVRVFLLWPNNDVGAAGPTKIPSWVHANFQVESVAYPCFWDGYIAAQKNEKAAELAEQKRKMNEAVLEKQRANNVMMLDILGNNAETAELQAELGAILSESASDSASTHAKPNDPQMQLRRRRGFYELWKSNNVYLPYSQIQLFGAGGSAKSSRNYFVVVVNQELDSDDSSSADSRPKKQKPQSKQGLPSPAPLGLRRNSTISDKSSSSAASPSDARSDPWAARFQAALKKNTIAAAVSKRERSSSVSSRKSPTSKSTGPRSSASGNVVANKSPALHPHARTLDGHSVDEHAADDVASVNTTHLEAMQEADVSVGDSKDYRQTKTTAANTREVSAVAADVAADVADSIAENHDADIQNPDPNNSTSLGSNSESESDTEVDSEDEDLLRGPMLQAEESSEEDADMLDML